MTELTRKEVNAFFAVAIMIDKENIAFLISDKQSVDVAQIASVRKDIIQRNSIYENKSHLRKITESTHSTIQL